VTMGVICPPAWPRRRVGAENMVVQDQVVVSDRLDCLDVVAHRDRIVTRLGLREDGAQLQSRLHRTINSSSRCSFSPRAPLAARSTSSARNCTRRILPELVFGNSANSRRRIRRNGATRSRMYRKISAARSDDGAWSGRVTTNALGTTPRIGSGVGTTAA